MEQLFIELAKNKDITDEEFTEELCYLYAKEKHEKTLSAGDSGDIRYIIGLVKQIRKRNPTPGLGDFSILNTFFLKSLRIRDMPEFHIHERYTMIIEKYEMNKRIQSLEQTLKTFMEQTKVERLSQEAVMQSLSNELDEFQEEFYDCQTEVKEQKERIELIEESLKQTVLEPVPFVKDKMA